MFTALDQLASGLDDLRDCGVEINVGFQAEAEVIDAPGSHAIPLVRIFVDRDRVTGAWRSQEDSGGTISEQLLEAEDGLVERERPVEVGHK